MITVEILHKLSCLKDRNFTQYLLKIQCWVLLKLTIFVMYSSKISFILCS